jgi:hypothetical protein
MPSRLVTELSATRNRKLKHEKAEKKDARATARHQKSEAARVALDKVVYDRALFQCRRERERRSGMDSVESLLRSRNSIGSESKSNRKRELSATRKRKLKHEKEEKRDARATARHQKSEAAQEALDKVVYDRVLFQYIDYDRRSTREASMDGHTREVSAKTSAVQQSENSEAKKKLTPLKHRPLFPSHLP